jgi:hypothetical protein
MKAIDSFLPTKKAQELYDFLVNKFELKNYRSINCYDSDRDLLEILDHQDISHNVFNNKEPYQLIINSFQKYCRCLGPHKLSKKIFRTLFLSPNPFQGGDLYFPNEDWEPDSTALGPYKKFEAAHNKLIIGNSQSQRFMSQIFDSTDPLIILTLDTA